MRWQVHGTDSASGKNVILVVEADQGEEAVQAAMGKGIVVRHVAGGRGHWFLSLGLVAMCCAAIALGAGCAMLYWQGNAAKAEAAEAMAENGRLGGALADAGEIVTKLEHRTQALEEAQGGNAKALVDALGAARNRVSELERAIAGDRERIAALDKLATAGERAKQDAAVYQSRAVELQRALDDQRKHARELETANAAAMGLEKVNHDLAGQIEVLKAQLLDQTTKSLAIPVAVANAEPAPPTAKHLRWAMGTSFDAASDFIALHFDKDATTSAPGSDGTMVTTGVLTANAATIRMVHDAEKDRVYSVTLSVSFAADAPKGKLAENQQLLAAYIEAFVPGFKEPGAWAAGVIKQLAGKDFGDRVVRVGDDFKVTGWNNRSGLYSWKIESSRGDLED